MSLKFCIICCIFAAGCGRGNGGVIIIIIMQHLTHCTDDDGLTTWCHTPLTHHVSVIRMTNRRPGGHVDLWVAVSVMIKALNLRLRRSWV